MTKKVKKKSAEEKVYAVGFKGFGPGMICRGKQYAENTVFEEEKAEICESGMHFCENPLDVLNFYPLIGENGKPNEFATVEALAEPKTDNIKSVTTKIRIGAKLSLKSFVKAAVDFSIEWMKKNNSASGDFSKLAASGDSSKLAASGYFSQLAASGYFSQLAASGNSSKLAASGDSSQLAASGDSSKLAASGDFSQLAASGNSSKLAASGDSSKLAASGNSSKLAASGDSSKLAASGYFSQLAASGDRSSVEATGKECVIAITGIKGKVKGTLGCFLACAEWEQNDNGEWHPVAFVSGNVDGKKLKADTWYTVKGGKFVEVKR